MPLIRAGRELPELVTRDALRRHLAFRQEVFAQQELPIQRQADFLGGPTIHERHWPPFDGLTDLHRHETHRAHKTREVLDTNSAPMESGLAVMPHRLLLLIASPHGSPWVNQGEIRAQRNLRKWVFLALGPLDYRGP